MNLLQYYLLKLSEECNEVGQMASKCMQFGLMEKHPDLQENNLQRLHMELDDLNAIIEVLNYRFNFDYKPSKERISEKKAKYAIIELNQIKSRTKNFEAEIRQGELSVEFTKTTMNLQIYRYSVRNTHVS